MKVISIVNTKGGVGKTTSSINIAAWLQKDGNRILLIDLDAQSSSSKMFGAYSEDDMSISDILIDYDININSIIKNTKYKYLDILPSNHGLAVAEEKIITSNENENKIFRLAHILHQIEDEYDYIIIDCPPAVLSVLSINALVASDDVIVPLKISLTDIDGLNNLLDDIEEIKEKYNPCLTFRGCFVTMDMNTKVNKDSKELLRQNLGDKLFNTSIRNNVKVTEASFMCEPVVFYDTKALASKDYRNLVNELLGDE